MPIPFETIAPFLAQGLNIGAGFLGANQQKKSNMELAAFQHQQNMELLKYQLDYNTPKAQMARFKDAGLNPNLVYGQGSSGNMSSAPQYPDVGRVDYQGVLADLGTKVQQSRLMSAQTDLTKTKVVESGIKQDLNKAQTELVKANPYLNSSYVSSMVSLLESSARLKENEAGVLLEHQFDSRTGHVNPYTRGQEKILAEIDLLNQRFELGKIDKQIKGRVLESKEFQNALQELQLKWMRDAEITPQHIYQGILMLLSKML